MRRERVAQLVRRDRRRDAGAARVALQELPEALPRHPYAARRYEERRFVRSRAAGANVGEVARDVRERDLSNRDEAALSAFAEDAHDAGLRVHVSDLHADELADAKARRVHELDHRRVACAAIGREVRRGEDALDFLEREDLREPSAETRAIYERGRIRWD